MHGKPSGSNNWIQLFDPRGFPCNYSTVVKPRSHTPSTLHPRDHYYTICGHRAPQTHITPPPVTNGIAIRHKHVQDTSRSTDVFFHFRSSISGPVDCAAVCVCVCVCLCVCVLLCLYVCVCGVVMLPWRVPCSPEKGFLKKRGMPARCTSVGVMLGVCVCVCVRVCAL